MHHRSSHECLAGNPFRHRRIAGAASFLVLEAVGGTLLLVLPYAYVSKANPTLISELRAYGGESGRGGAFDPLLFGSALTVGIALITQMGDQVDYLRLMPEKTPATRGRW